MARKRKKPSFCKILAGDFSHRLRIPPKFIQNFNGGSVNRCSLRGPSRKWWHMELEERENGLFLYDGWQHFVKEHHLEDGDVLIFRFDGESKFKVSIYGRDTYCEKDAEAAEMRSGGPVFLGSGGGQTRVKEETVGLETEEVDSEICEKQRSNSGNHVINHPVHATSNGSILFKSNKLCFTVNFKEHHRRCMYIPKKVAVAEGLMSKSCLTIQDPAGRSWLVNLRSRPNKSLHCLEMATGLTKFCRANQIVPGHTLIFEFVKGSLAKVYIFKKGCKVVLDIHEKNAPVNEMRSGSPISLASEGQARVKEETVDLQTEEYNEYFDEEATTSRKRIHVTPQKRHEDDHAEAKSNGSILFESNNSCFTVNFKKFHATCMYIPKKVAVAEGLMRKSCLTIQDPAGRSWLVTLRSRNKSLHCLEMRTGLTKFCRANQIVPGDALIFEFVKESLAKVHIFRNGGNSVVLDVPNWDAGVTGTRSGSPVCLASEGQARVKEETIDLETEEYKENIDTKAAIFGKSAGKGSEDDHVEATSNKGQARVKEETIDLETEEYNENIDTEATIFGKSAGKRSEDDHVEATSSKGSMLVKTENLCFTITAAKHYRSRIDIPKRVAVAQGLMSKKFVTIQDPTGRSWLVQLKFRPNGYSQRVEMRTGLPNIFRANQIVPGDTLIFEFVKESVAKLHIFRKGSNSVVLDVPA